MEQEDSKRIERLLANLRSAIRDDLDAAKHEILDRIREVESSVEIIAREMERRGERQETRGNLTGED